jgi:hypothetical protein
VTTQERDLRRRLGKLNTGLEAAVGRQGRTGADVRYTRLAWRDTQEATTALDYSNYDLANTRLTSAEGWLAKANGKDTPMNAAPRSTATARIPVPLRWLLALVALAGVAPLAAALVQYPHSRSAAEQGAAAVVFAAVAILAVLAIARRRAAGPQSGPAGKDPR